MLGALTILEQHILLAITALDGDAYGMSIQAHIEEKANYRLTTGSVYSSLNKMGRKGLVTTNIGDPSPFKGGKAKTYYKITKGGKETLLKSLKQLRMLVAKAGMEIQ